MAGRPPGTAQGGESADPPPRRCRSAARRPALAARRQGLCVRHARRPAHPGRAVRRPIAADHPALHVWARLGTGLPQLLIHGRPHRRHEPAPRQPRRDFRRGIPRTAGRSGALPPAHGVEVPLGVLQRQQLQLRFPRQLYPRGGGQRTYRLQFRRMGRDRRGMAGRQRLHQRRSGNGVSHLFDLRPGRRSDDGHLRHARPGAEGAQRNRRHGLAAPSRSVSKQA